MQLQAPAGWFRLIGPVFFCDLVRTARRRGYLMVRWGYPVAVFGILLLESAIWSIFNADALSQKYAGDFCAAFFVVYMLFNLLAVFLLTPAYTAGALVEEKEHQTLDALLASDLRDREIILGTYFARITKIGLIFLAPLPIFSFLQFLGGVEPLLIVAGFAFTAISLCSLAALSLFFSVRSERPRDALVKTYLATFAFVVSLTMIWASIQFVPNWKYFPGTANKVSPISVEDVVHWANIGNPLVLWLEVIRGIATGLTLDKLLPDLFRNYVAFHGAVILCALIYATLFLRKFALGLNQESDKARDRDFSIKAWLRANWNHLPILSERPMLWKEFFIERQPSRSLWRRMLLGLGVAIMLLPLVHVAFFFRGQVFPNEYLRPKELMSLWLRFLSAILGCIALVQTLAVAAGSISGERDKQTLGELLATPLTNRSIFFAKWQAAIFRFGPAWAGLLGLWVIGLGFGFLHPAAILAFLLCWLCFAAFLASLGIWFSVVCRTTRQATAIAFLTFSAILGCTVLASYNLAEKYLPLFEAVGIFPAAMLAYLTFTPNEWTHWLAGKVEFRPTVYLLDLSFWCVGSLGLFLAARSRFGVLTGRVEGDAQTTAPPDLAALNASPAETRPPTRWLSHFAQALSSYSKRLGFLAVGILPAVVLVAVYLFRAQRGEENLRGFLAHLDATEPGWQHYVVQDENAAADPQGHSARAIMLRVEALLPANWPPEAFDAVVREDWPDRELIPSVQLRKLMEEREHQEGAASEARKLYDVGYRDLPEPWGMPMHTMTLGHKLERLLDSDVLVHIQEGHLDDALAMTDAIVIMAAALGESASNYYSYAKMQRHTSVLSALKLIQRTLAQGEASESSLAKAQRILEKEDLPHLARMLHMERARLNWILSHARANSNPGEWEMFHNLSGSRNDPAVPPFPNMDELIFLTAGSTLEDQRGEVLWFLTDCISGKAKLSNQPTPWRFGLRTTLTEYYQLDLNHFASSIGYVKCRLRTTIAALALERYRLAQGSWPSTLEELLPLYLKSIPLGPNDDKPLIYKRLPDGVVVYTLGPGLFDNGGKLSRQQMRGVGFDIGVRLWDAPSRRPLPATKVEDAW